MGIYPGDGNMGRVEGKVAIVTGATSGIGRATAELLAKEGAKVAVCGRNAERGQEVVESIKKAGGIAKFWKLDVTKEEEVERVFAEVAKEFEKIDILVNCAGIVETPKPPHEVTEDEWNAVMNVNAKGVFLCMKHVIPYMKKAGGGSIINMSSTAGLVGFDGILSYCASKGAIRLMTKSAAITYGKDNIRVNSVHPSAVWTPMLKKNCKDMGILDEEECKKTLAQMHPIRRIGEPIDVAYAVLYLASDESKFVTGAELVVDGGLTAK